MAAEFVDYYKVFKVGPRANAAEIGQKFHRLVRRYHPDNKDTGDRDKFSLIVEAHNVLRDPGKRAKYDVAYEQNVGPIPKLEEVESDFDAVASDVEIQHRLLAVLYARRRRSVREPGVPEFELETIFACPIEQLEFHLWYLKAKGWVERTDNGMLAITVAGIDYVNSEHTRTIATKLLMDRRGLEDDLD